MIDLTLSRAGLLLGVLLATAFLAYAAAKAGAAERLPSYSLDSGQSSVSGLSSGGYMAGQFAVAFSSTIAGAGIVAAGPYYCAQGQPLRALNQCMATRFGPPDAAALFLLARRFARTGEIDDVANVARQRIYIFSGGSDRTVAPSVAAEARDFYRLAGVDGDGLEFVAGMPAGHGFVTADFGNACETSAPPFVNDCDYDQAGAILGRIYGKLEPPAAAPAGRIVSFDQAEFLADARRYGLDETGFLYEPAACRGGERCRAHIVFHGCRQSHEAVGDAVYAKAGYNRWAETNKMLVLYPQATALPANPNGCWDWFGYTGPAYATKSGLQMAAVRRMLDRVAGK